MKLTAIRFTIGCAFLAQTPVASANSSSQEQSSSADVLQETSVRAKVEALRLPHRPGVTPAWHAPGSGGRAEYLQRLLDDQRTFFGQVFDVEAPIGLAVLAPGDWLQVAPNIPYGMPHVSGKPFTAVMPASWNEVRWLPLPTREEADPGLVQMSDDLNLDWDEALRSGADLIVTHEFGHTLLHQLEIDPQSLWFGEFLATYVGLTFISEKRPELAGPNRLFNLSVANGPHPRTSLRYLDENYREIVRESPANYAWYQGRIFERTEAVYAEHGLAFLVEVKRIFARGETMTHDEVLDRLEQISPGWKAWAASMEAMGIAT
jgi:hypothetical protein